MRYWLAAIVPILCACGVGAESSAHRANANKTAAATATANANIMTAQRGTRRPRQAETRDGSWLIGWWIEREEACVEGGVRYDANSIYTTDVEIGRWRIEGDTLVETAMLDGETGDPIQDARPSRSRILTIAANGNAFSVRYPDGQVWHMKRCS